MFQGQKTRLLSQTNRLALIKTVLKVLPCYQMASMLFPKHDILHIERMIRNFKCGSNLTNVVHLLSWYNLIKPKVPKGLGLKDLEAINKALLAKQLWKVISRSYSLLGKLIISKYGRGNVKQVCQNHSRSSQRQKAITKVSNLIEEKF